MWPIQIFFKVSYVEQGTLTDWWTQRYHISYFYVHTNLKLWCSQLTLLIDYTWPLMWEKGQLNYWSINKQVTRPVIEVPLWFKKYWGLCTAVGGIRWLCLYLACSFWEHRHSVFFGQLGWKPYYLMIGRPGDTPPILVLRFLVKHHYTGRAWSFF